MDQDIVQSDDITWGEQQISGDAVATGSKVATDLIKFREYESVSDGTWRYHAPYRAIPLSDRFINPMTTARNLFIQPQEDV